MRKDAQEVMPSLHSGDSEFSIEKCEIKLLQEADPIGILTAFRA